MGALSTAISIKTQGDSRNGRATVSAEVEEAFALAGAIYDAALEGIDAT